MGTVTDKLAYLNETKTSIKNAIIEKGGDVSDEDSFRDYAEKISNIVVKDDSAVIGLLEGTLEHIDVPEGTTKLRKYCFNRYDTPFSITLPNSVKTIESQCFYNCYGLKSITLSNQITELPSQAFGYCSALESIELPDSITYIDYGVFSGCSSMKSIKLSNNISELPSSLFSQCTALESLTIPTSVTKIGSSLIAHNKLITSISIPAGVSSMDSYALGYSAIKEIHVDKPNGGLAGYPWGADDCEIIYWNDGTTTEFNSFEDLFG